MSTSLLAHDRAGAGEPLLLLHGLGAARADFASVTPRLTPSFDVLAVDLPGHGDSPPVRGRPTVAALADALEEDLDARALAGVHVFGTSLGGRLALELARRHRALSVVAASPSGLATPPERAFEAFALGSARLRWRVGRPLIHHLARSSLGRTALLAQLRARPWEASREEALAVRDGMARARSFWPMLRETVLLDVPQGLDAITCPVVIVQGVLDVIAPAQAPRFLAVVPQARFRALPWSGHAPLSDAAGTIVDLVRSAAALAAPDSGDLRAA